MGGDTDERRASSLMADSGGRFRHPRVVNRSGRERTFSNGRFTAAPALCVRPVSQLSALKQRNERSAPGPTIDPSACERPQSCAPRAHLPFRSPARRHSASRLQASRIRKLRAAEAEPTGSRDASGARSPVGWDGIEASDSNGSEAPSDGAAERLERRPSTTGSRSLARSRPTTDGGLFGVQRTEAAQGDAAQGEAAQGSDTESSASRLTRLVLAGLSRWTSERDRGADAPTPGRAPAQPGGNRSRARRESRLGHAR